MDIYGKADRFDHAVRGRMQLLFSFFCGENFPREENARAAADFLNQTHPHKILNFTLEIPKHEPMYEPHGSPDSRAENTGLQMLRHISSYRQADFGWI